MAIYPWFRLLRLDISLLINIGVKAISDAGVLLSFPLIITGIVFAMLSVISFFINVFMQPIGFTGGIKPWMVRRQLSLISIKKKVDLDARTMVHINLQ